MGSLCFSSATILRCESFTSLQSQLLIIPTALELIFSTTLIFTNWGTGWRHLLLTAEGWSYFALALLELLSHNIPAVRDNVSVFTIVDIVLGAASFLPIFFYISFVYLFTRNELIDTLPKRFQRIANILLVFFIPAIVALNELSSFVGISRRTLSVNNRLVVAIGFRTFSDQQLWTFLTSLTLALLTAFEAINFCFAFYRLIRAFVDQRRIETTSTDQAHLIRGIGWITGGFKLGAIETVIGFAQGGFGGALTRRIIRFLARAFLIIGIVKGVDQIDDFTNLTKEMSSGRTQQFRRSRLGMLISNPRFSTFRQLSPTAGAFYSEKGKGREVQPAFSYPAPPAPTAAYDDGYPAPAMADFVQLKRQVTQQRASEDSRLRPQQRVTVQYSAGAPTLQMRFSGLEMPSPALIAESVKARPVSASWVSIARSSRYAPSTAGGMSPNFAYDAPPVPMAYPEYIYDRKQPQQPTAADLEKRQHARGVSDFSVRSYPDSLNAVRELTAQFPGPPPVSSTRPPMPSPIPEAASGSGWGADLEAHPRNERDAYTAYSVSVFDNDRRSESAYAYGGVRTPPPPPPQQQRQQQRQRPQIRTTMDREDPDSPEPVYRYSYDGPVSPSAERERVQHPYVYAYSPAVGNDDYSPPANIDAYTTPVFTNPFANPAVAPVPNNAYAAYNAYAAANPYPARNETRHRNGRSDTTLGTTPMTYQSSRFDVEHEREQAESSTPDTETETTNQELDPFRFDGPALNTGLSAKAYAAAGGAGYAFPREAQGVPEPVYMDDGPHGEGGHVRSRSEMTLEGRARTSAALLQMTQRGDADWAPAGVEFTPSVFAPSISTPASSTRNTLKKKRRPETRADVPANVGVSPDTLASSWLHNDLEDGDADAFADDEQAVVHAAAAHRVKSVGRVRAPRKATPAPVAARHGLNRASVYIQPITVPPAVFSSEVQIVQGGSSADSYSSEFKDRP